MSLKLSRITLILSVCLTLPSVIQSQQLYAEPSQSVTDFSTYSTRLLQNRDTTKFHYDLNYNEPNLTDSILIALYRAEVCFQVGIESEHMIDRLYGLWEAEYNLRREDIRQKEAFQAIANRTERELDDERLFSLDYAKRYGKEEKRKKAWRKVAVGGIPIWIGSGILVGMIVSDRL